MKDSHILMIFFVFILLIIGCSNQTMGFFLDDGTIEDQLNPLGISANEDILFISHTVSVEISNTWAIS